MGALCSTEMLKSVLHLAKPSPVCLLFFDENTSWKFCWLFSQPGWKTDTKLCKTEQPSLQITHFSRKKKFKKQENVGWQCSSTHIAEVSKTTSLTDWHCCEREEDDKATERAMFHTDQVTPRRGRPASSEKPETNVSCHRSTWETGTTLTFQGTSVTGLDNLADISHTTYNLITSQSCPPARWDAHALLTWGMWLRVQHSPSWQLMPACLPEGWEHRCLGGGGRGGGGGRWCQWHVSHHA